MGDKTDISEHLKAAERPVAPDLITIKPSGPNLARIMSISGIMLAVIAAAAMAAERMFSEPATTFQVASDGSAEPAPPDGAIMNFTDPDATDVQLAERRIVLLERQIILLQSQLRDAQTDDTGFMQRIAVLERRLGEVEQSVANKQVVERIAMGDSIIPETVAQASDDDNLITGSIPEPAAQEPQTLSPPVAQTLPVEDDIARFASAEARADTPRFVTQTRFALSLDLHEDIDALKTRWNGLRDRFGDVFEGLHARALHQGTENGQVHYRLLLGPIENAAAAAGRCAQLQARGVRCTQTIFGGELIDEPPSPVARNNIGAQSSARVPQPPFSEALSRILANPPTPPEKPDRSDFQPG